MSSRRLGLVASLAAAVVVLGACTGDDEPEPPAYIDPTVAADQAQQTYGPLVAEVVEAVAGAGGTEARRVDPPTLWRDSELDSCMYESSRYELDVVFGEEVGWPEVRDATAGVLDAQGFELTDQLDIPGGHNGFDATAEDGARLAVRSKLGRPSTIDLVAPVLGDCPASGSETLAP